MYAGTVPQCRKLDGSDLHMKQVQRLFQGQQGRQRLILSLNTLTITVTGFARYVCSDYYRQTCTHERFEVNVHPMSQGPKLKRLIPGLVLMWPT